MGIHPWRRCRFPRPQINDLNHHATANLRQLGFELKLITQKLHDIARRHTIGARGTQKEIDLGLDICQALDLWSLD